MIKIKNVRAGYRGGPDILHGIWAEASPSEIVTILGPNGCGKSTLLKCVAGFLTPRDGEIFIQSQDVSNVPVHLKIRNHRVSFVPQTDNVFATLTVAENIMIGAQSMSRSDSRISFDELMAQYPSLANKMNRKASALSGGERQILSLARALISRPEILLLDEPSAGLSPMMMHEVFATIAAIRDRTGMCIMMVEQNAFEALNVADRAYVLSLGKVAIHGRASELLADPSMRHIYLGGDADDLTSDSAPDLCAMRTGRV